MTIYNVLKFSQEKGRAMLSPFVPARGFEPLTLDLQDRRATNCAKPAYGEEKY